MLVVGEGFVSFLSANINTNIDVLKILIFVSHNKFFVCVIT